MANIRTKDLCKIVFQLRAKKKMATSIINNLITYKDITSGSNGIVNPGANGIPADRVISAQVRASDSISYTAMPFTYNGNPLFQVYRTNPWTPLSVVMTVRVFYLK